MTHLTRRAAGRHMVATALAGATSLAFAGQAAAALLPQPSERPILTVSGKIANTNKGDAAQFDRPMLEALGMSGFETTTPWYKGPVAFEGVPMDVLMRHVGAEGQRVIAIALNDYASEIPLEDFRKYNVILALKRDGEYMPVRDKGPLFIVYPFDSDPALKSRTFYGRSVWQVAKLVVK